MKPPAESLCRLVLAGCLAAAGAVSLGLASCAAPAVAVTAGLAAAQVGYGVYTNGELRGAWQATLPQCYTATKAALRELEVDLRTDRVESGARAFLMARDDGRPEMKITIERVSENVTAINIRIGILGDQAVSRLIMARIEQYIPKPPEPVPVRPEDAFPG